MVDDGGLIDCVACVQRRNACVPSKDLMSGRVGGVAGDSLLGDPFDEAPHRSGCLTWVVGAVE
jgi:hypothetical protein